MAAVETLCMLGTHNAHYTIKVPTSLYCHTSTGCTIVLPTFSSCSRRELNAGPLAYFQWSEANCSVGLNKTSGAYDSM